MTNDAIRIEDVGFPTELDEDSIAKMATSMALVTRHSLEGASRLPNPIIFDWEQVVSMDRMFLVARFAVRDIQLSQEDQKGKLSISKYVGYLTYWFSKLRPVQGVYRADATGQQREIMDINERVAIDMISHTLYSITTRRPDLVPDRWGTCPATKALGSSEKPIPGKCFYRAFYEYLVHQNQRYLNYITYCLRYRLVGPYFMISIIDQAIHYACYRQMNIPLGEIVPSAEQERVS